MASKASSIQPRAAAKSVRRWAEVACAKGKPRLVGMGRIVNGQRPIGKSKSSMPSLTERPAADLGRQSQSRALDLAEVRRPTSDIRTRSFLRGFQKTEILPRLMHIARHLFTQRIHRGKLYFVAQALQEINLYFGVGRQRD